MILRLVWLLPLTAAFLLFLPTALIAIFVGFSITHLLLTAGIAYPLYRAWKDTVQAIRGKTELNRKRTLYAAIAAAALVLLLTLAIIPKMLDLVRYSVSGSQKGTLAEIRTALEGYKQAKGAYPAEAAEVEAMVSAPGRKELWDTRLKLYEHRSTKAINAYASAEARDTGNWAYVNDPASPDFGRFYIDCTHTDQYHGLAWSTY